MQKPTSKLSIENIQIIKKKEGETEGTLFKSKELMKVLRFP